MRVIPMCEECGSRAGFHACSCSQHQRTASRIEACEVKAAELSGMFGFDFVLGRSCWHIIGYTGATLPLRRFRMCGWKGEAPCGGSAYDVVRSQVPVCRACDRTVDGAGSADVESVRTALCPTCDLSGQLWDPRVHGNVVTCSHPSLGVS